MDDSALHERIRLTVDRFLLSENTSHEAKEVLLQYAEARPDRANPDPIIPMDEIEMRLELIAKVQRTNDTSSTDITQSNIDGHFQFTVLQLSYLMLIPISFLRDLSQMSWVYLQPYLNLDTYLSFSKHFSLWFFYVVMNADFVFEWFEAECLEIVLLVRGRPLERPSTVASVQPVREVFPET